jgi:hypothetical protein
MAQRKKHWTPNPTAFGERNPASAGGIPSPGVPPAFSFQSKNNFPNFLFEK